MNSLFIALILIFFAIGWTSATGVKHQIVRLGDVFIYGPALIWIAFVYNGQGEAWVPYFLLFLGVTTISYNLRNYLHELDIQ